MSVDSLLRDAQVQADLARLLPEGPIKLGLQLRLPPRRPSGQLVGTAYDYAVRFELERRFPTARSSRWVAERAVDEVGVVAGLEAYLDMTTANGVQVTIDGDIAARWAKVVRDARKAHKASLSEPSPTASTRQTMVGHALRLARIDPFVRARFVDEDPSRVDPLDIQDVVGLLESTPFDKLGSGAVLLLNPTFGEESARVGGADADIISGTSLFDLKTVKTPNPRGDLSQLLAYLFLARAAHAGDNSFPAISTVGIYYSRQCHLWLHSAHEFDSMAAFEEVERRFFERAEELFPKPVAKKTKKPAAPERKKAKR
ncbi:MAG TPA: hypothetical protein VGQ83_07960 [Polyangia bacterium]|jgi:hypothetical protein